MTSHGDQEKIIQELARPSGNTNSAYILPALSGEVIYIPCSLSATRLLVTGKETNNAFAVVGSGGTAAAPIGFHFHRETHDVFLCLKGQVNIWAGEKCRTMYPGDFASVPPGTLHQYQMVGEYTEFLGLIVPGGWEEFFRFIGEPYNGPLFPLKDDRNPFEVLIPKLKAATQEFDMIPVPQHPQFDPQPWEQSDSILPDGLQPYFLRNGSGPKYELGGLICRPLVTTSESNGKFSIGSIEGSSHHESPIFSSKKNIKFNGTHHCIQVADGKIKCTVGGRSAVLAAMETLFIPAGTEFSFTFASNLAKAYVFSNGGGLVELICKAGSEYGPPLISEKAATAGQIDPKLEQQLGYTIV